MTGWRLQGYGAMHLQVYSIHYGIFTKGRRVVFLYIACAMYDNLAERLEMAVWGYIELRIDDLLRLKTLLNQAVVDRLWVPTTFREIHSLQADTPYDKVFCQIVCIVAERSINSS